MSFSFVNVSGGGSTHFAFQIENEFMGSTIELCDLCFVQESKQSGNDETFLIPVVKRAQLMPSGFYPCVSTQQFVDSLQPYIVIQSMSLSEIRNVELLAQCPSHYNAFQGILATLLDKNLNSVRISDKIKTESPITDNYTWLFVNSKSPLFVKYGIASKLMNFSTEQETSNISSHVINLSGAPMELKVVGGSIAFLTAVIILILTVLVRQFDKKFFVYDLELFLKCKRRREKLTAGIFIGRITVLGSILGGVVIIIFSLTFTLVPIPFQYILDGCFLLASASAFMFLWARFVIYIKTKKTSLTMRFQISLIVPSVPIGLIAGVIIILFKDETYLGTISAMAYDKIGIF